MNVSRAILVGVCALVIGIYVCTAHSGVYVSGTESAAENPYNLLVKGFQTGQLNLKKDAPLGLTQLVDPYDPTKNALYRGSPYWAHDLSYYKGKFYLYWGITPALILFWPYVTLTGHYLSFAQAGSVFCSVGFLAGMCLLVAMWHRYFPRVSVWVVAPVGLALGLATGIPFLLAWCDVYEVAIGCAYALVMLALAAVWNSLHKPSRRGRWAAAASLAYGLAVGARPNLLFGAAILLVPVVQEWRQKRRFFTSLLASSVPMVLIGLGLMLYNLLRFGDPFEFGSHYQLTSESQLTLPLFSLRYLWSNFGAYFLEPTPWNRRFPFVVLGGRLTFGILTDVPLVWLALATPLAWRNRPPRARFELGAYLATVVVLFGASSLTLGFLAFAAGRYEVDFLPMIVLLAGTGVLGLERALSSQSMWRRAARLGWCAVLVYSVTFNLFVSIGRCAEADCRTGIILYGRGRMQETIKECKQALRLYPDYAEAHNWLGLALRNLGRLSEAREEFEQTVRLKPDLAAAQFNLGFALMGEGQLEEAIAHMRESLRIEPDHAEVRVALGDALMRQDKPREAIEQYKAAVRLDPDWDDASYDLGVALAGVGQVQDAIEQWQKTRRTNPNFGYAHLALGDAYIQAGKLQDAIGQWQQAVRTNPDLVEAHSNLGFALEKLGREAEAIAEYEQALKLRPDFAPARDALTRLGVVQ